MHASKPITVVVAHFEDLLALGINEVLRGDPDLEVVARDFVPERIGVTLRAHRPLVAILDVDALATLAEVRELNLRHPHTRLVLLATRPSTAECAQLLAFGASACLGRATQARDLLTAVHLASRGLQMIPRVIGESTDAAPYALQLLTRREAEVLPMLQQGSSNAQIAVALHLGVETIRTHASNIYRKLGVSSRRELAAVSTRPAPPEAGSGAPHPERRRAAARDRNRRPSGLRTHNAQPPA